MIKKLSIIALICGIINATGHSTAQNPPVNSFSDLRKSCSAIGGEGSPTVFGENVLSERTPSASFLQVPDDCKKDAAKMIDGWKKQDIADWERLSNQACAAKLGWVEITPNTCSAGGPPPICVANHWVRNSAKAESSWRESKADIRRKREQQMIAAACSCYRAKLDENDDADSTADAFKNYKPGDQVVTKAYTENTYKIPCSGETCPPGYSCKNQVCLPPNTLKTTVEQGKDFAKAQLKGAALERAIEESLRLLGSRVSVLLDTMKGKVFVGAAGGLLDAEPFSLYKSGYENTTTKVYASSRRLYVLTVELEAARNGRIGRQPNFIVEEIEETRDSLTNDIRSLSEYYNGVVRERELCRYCCYEAFAYQHQEMIKAYSTLMGLSATGNL